MLLTGVFIDVVTPKLLADVVCSQFSLGLGIVMTQVELGKI